MVDVLASEQMGNPRCGRWTECLEGLARPRGGRVLIGALPGEGVGPEVVQCALAVLASVAGASGLNVEVRVGGAIGRGAERSHGVALPPGVIQFCREVFGEGGAILNGPGGSRYVYDLRKHFDLFFKISPLQIVNGCPDACRLRPEAVAGVDILVTRENTGGIYQGSWEEHLSPAGRLARQHFAYSEGQVRRFLHASARLARQRRGELTVVWKDAGLPTISRLWRDCAADAAAACDVRYRMVDVDLMAYLLIQDAAAFDVIAAPNLCGDVLADLGAVLLGSRALSYSGNYSANGHAVYQTNHGGAYDLAGTDRANPVGQIFSLAMLLRESFGLQRQADAIIQAVRDVWAEGGRTADLGGGRTIGTREMGRRIADRAAQRVADRNWSRAA